MMLPNGDNNLYNYTQVHLCAKAYHIQRYGEDDYYDRFRFADHWFIKGSPFVGTPACMFTGKNSLESSWFDPLFDSVYTTLSDVINHTVDPLIDRYMPAKRAKRRSAEPTVGDLEYGANSGEFLDSSYSVYDTINDKDNIQFMENPMLKTDSKD